MVRLAEAKTAVVGTSGWVYRHWAGGVFYPAGLPASRWFAHYAGVFDTVEINNTFYRLSFCIYDLPGVPCPRWVTGPVIYARFHGSDTRYGGRYSQEELRRWASLLRDLGAGTAPETGDGAQRPVYVYFGNDAEGHAVRNALELRGMLGAG